MKVGDGRMRSRLVIALAAAPDLVPFAGHMSLRACGFSSAAVCVRLAFNVRLEEPGAYVSIEWEGPMQVPDIWGKTDLRMLQLVVELQLRNNGDFLLDQLMDKVGLLDRGDLTSSFGPWNVIESLRRLEEAGFIQFHGNILPDDNEDEDDYLDELDRRWLNADSERREREIEREIKRHKQEFSRRQQGRELRIKEAFFKGKMFEDAYWRGGRFYIDGAVQVIELRSKPDGLRRVGAWPNPEKVNEDLVAILGDLANSIERRNPKDAKKLREIGNVLRSNAIELSAALLAKLLEHAAGL